MGQTWRSTEVTQGACLRKCRILPRSLQSPSAMVNEACIWPAFTESVLAQWFIQIGQEIFSPRAEKVRGKRKKCLREGSKEPTQLEGSELCEWRVKKAELIRSVVEVQGSGAGGGNLRSIYLTEITRWEANKMTLPARSVCPPAAAGPSLCVHAGPKLALAVWVLQQ